MITYIEDYQNIFGDGCVDELRLINDEILSVVYCVRNNKFVCYEIAIKHKDKILK